MLTRFQLNRKKDTGLLWNFIQTVARFPMLSRISCVIKRSLCQSRAHCPTHWSTEIKQRWRMSNWLTRKANKGMNLAWMYDNTPQRKLTLPNIWMFEKAQDFWLAGIVSLTIGTKCKCSLTIPRTTWFSWYPLTKAYPTLVWSTSRGLNSLNAMVSVFMI